MPTRRTLLIAAVPAGLAVASLAKVIRASPRARVNTLDSADGSAIKGYDPVAYFRVGQPTPGRKEYSASYAGATWLFANEENKWAFEATPDTYLPAYGGYCAYGVAQGYLVKVEPEAWSIRDGRLYLNYDLNVRRQWLRDPAKYVDEADRNWSRLSAAVAD
jgi:YHS domain-containing protein